MAARRHPTAPVDALDRRIDWTDVGARATAGLTRWVLGPGLLSLHALAFVVVGLGMTLWNILTDPADITVDEPLLRWGIVLALHAAAVLIGWTVWRIARPPAARRVYRPTPRAALGSGRPAPLVAEPVWYPNGSANGSVNGHAAHPAGAWPDQPRTVVTSRRVTTLVVATARDGIASARRRYRREHQPAQPNGTHPPQPWPHPGAAPAQASDGLLPPANGVDPGHPADGQPASSWSAAITRDEVISVTQVGPEPAARDAERAAAGEHGTDPVRSWLDGYLDGQVREREARWTWVEAAASTWLARGEAPEPALPASAQPPEAANGRPPEATPSRAATTHPTQMPPPADLTQKPSPADPTQAPPTGHAPGASPG